MRRWRRYYECVRHGPSSAAAALDGIRHLPEFDLAEVMRGGPALIVAPHPDDESLGCGGLIVQAAALGASVHIAVVTDGAASHPGLGAQQRSRLRQLRRDETLDAAAVLGVTAGCVSFMSLPDGRAPHRGRGAEAAGQRLASLARDISAQTIFTSWNYDSHPDHVAAHRYAGIAARETQAALFSYPVWAWMLPRDTLMPNRHWQGFSIDITPQLAIKRAAVLRHRSQTTPMVADDPSGFTLSDAQLAAMITSREFFIAENPRAREFVSGRAGHGAALG